MRHLFLMRHAKARQASGDMSDHQRPLRRHGKRQAAAMAGPLQRWGALAGEIHVSSARRSWETLAALDAAVPTLGLAARAQRQDALYAFEGEALLDWVKRLPDPTERVLVIGHNPALVELGRWLCHDAPDRLPTGGLLHLVLPGVPWQALAPDCAWLAASLVPAAASHALFQRRAPAPRAQGKADLAGCLQMQLGHLYALVRALEPGVMAGADPEFLHQYRVNLRRSRAIGEALLAIARAPGRDKVPGLKRHLKHFKRRAQGTSDLRDLDVFLARLATAPPAAEEGTRRALHGWLSERARGEQQRLCQQLRQPDYAVEMQAWEAYLEGEAFREALARITPARIEAVLAERIADHNRDLVALSLEAPDQAFHDLRKTVKRIRYLAELQPKRHRALLADLKQRQTLLGELQDLCTREAWLATFVESGAAPADASADIAAWQAALQTEKDAQREAIMTLAPLNA